MNRQIVEPFSPNLLSPQSIYFTFYTNPFSLDASIEGKEYKNILAIPAFPLTANEELVHLYERSPEGGVGNLIGVIENIANLSSANQVAIKQLLMKVNNLPIITKITNILDEYHLFHWFIETDRGPIDFFIEAPRRHIAPFGANALLIKDLQGDMFHIPDRTALDQQSKDYLYTVY